MQIDAASARAKLIAYTMDLIVTGDLGLPDRDHLAAIGLMAQQLHEGLEFFREAWIREVPAARKGGAR